MDRRIRASLWIAAVIALVLVLGLGWGLLADGDQADSSATGEGVDASASARASFADPSPTSTTKLDLAGAPKATISGTIHDPAGGPIADAQVCALASGDGIRGFDDHRHRCVRSGPDGHYRIEGLFPVETRVHASAATFRPGRWERRISTGVRRTVLKLRAGETTDHVDIELEQGGVVIRGVVKDIAGGEIEDAQVSIDGGWLNRRGGTAVGLSDEQGGFELWVAPGEAIVHAFADGYAEGLVEATAPREFVELFLTPESVLVGKVVLASTGEPVADAIVDAGFGRGADQAARTDVEGRFRIKQLQPGAYKPWAESERLYGQAAEQVHLGLGETSDEVVIRVHPAHTIEGRVVVAGSGSPCPLGSVALKSDTGEGKQARTDDEGHVELRGVLAGEYEVSVTCRGYIREQEYPKLVVGEDELAALVWEVREGLAIRGEVVDERGQPLEAISVGATPIVDPEAAREQTTRAGGRSEADGQFELAGLLPGRYEVQVQGWRARPGPLEPITIELESGADVNDVRIVMPAVGGIRGRIVDESGTPVSGAQLAASLIGGSSGGASRSNDAGEFELSELRPGPTRVVANDGGGFGGVAMRKPGTGDDDLQGEVVEVIADEVVEVVLTVESRDGRITGVVSDEDGGPVADAFIDVERMSESAGANAVAARRSIRWSWGSQPVLTDQDGRFELDGLPKGKFIVRANRKGGGDAIVEDVALGSHVALVIATTGELAGTVELADGSTPERFSISVQDKAGGVYLRDSYFRTEGAWRLREVPAGRYEITATAGQGTAILEPALELGEGEVREDIELHLTSRLTIRGRVVDLETREPVAGLEVHVSGGRSFGFGRGAGPRLNVSDADGRFEIEDAPAGQVYIMALNRGAGSKAKYDDLWRAMTLKPEPVVQEIGELELVARRLERNQDAGDIGFGVNRWDPTIEPEGFEATVALVRPGGPADGSGLVAGDVIEKVDGHSVLGVDGGRFHSLTRVPVGTELTFGLRGGNSVEIVAGPPLR